MSRADYAVEALLRPPVEIYPAVTALGCAVVAFVAPWAVLMPPRMGMVTGAALLGFSAYRGKQAWEVIRYQRGMKRLPRYVMKAARIPVSARRLFLGKGFRWTQRHTQRLRDTMRPEAARFIEPGALYRAARVMEEASERVALLRPLARLTASSSGWNPVAPLPPVGGKPQIHAVEPNEQDVAMELGERVGHMVVYGSTRQGKTRLLNVLAHQDVMRGDVTIVIDPKGDGELLKNLYAAAVRAGRQDVFYVFHLGFPQISARYNPVGEFSRITQVSTRVTNPLPSTGNSAAFKEFCWRFANIIARAISALGRKPDYKQILSAVNDIEPLFLEYTRHWLADKGPTGWDDEISRMRAGLSKQKTPRHLEGRSLECIAYLQYLRRHNIHDAVMEGLTSVFKYERTHFDKLVSSLGPLLEKLTTGPVADLLSPDYFDVDDHRPIFDWMKVIRQRGIVYVGLDALTDSAVATAVGNSMFADLVSVAGEIYKHGVDGESNDIALPKVNLHLDEFSDLVGEEFVPMANKVGGAGFQLNVYTQTSADIVARMGNAARGEQVMGNLNSMIMFRVRNIETARQLTDQLPEVDVTSLTVVSGVTDASASGTGVDFTSTNQDRVATQKAPMVAPADVMALPKGQAFAYLEGTLYKIRVPLPDASDDRLVPKSIRDLAAQMEKGYRTSDQWWRAAEQPGSSGAMYVSDEEPKPDEPGSKQAIEEAVEQ